MTYKLEFEKTALKAWYKLGADVKAQFKKKLAKVLESPVIPKNRLKFHDNYFKIKLRASGYRLVYSVEGETFTVRVLTVAPRDKAYAKL